jgi:hypothetical protein
MRWALKSEKVELIEIQIAFLNGKDEENWEPFQSIRSPSVRTGD